MVSQAHANKRGYDLWDLRAVQIEDADFAIHDLPLTEFCLVIDSPTVPDPYLGGANGFDVVLDLVRDACDGLLRQIKDGKLK